MGAPIGNDNRAKQYRIQRTIESALRKRSASDELEALEQLIDAQIDKASQGDLNSFRELMDRYAGKATQSSDVTVNGSLTAVLSGLGRDNGSKSDDPTVA